MSLLKKLALMFFTLILVVGGIVGVQAFNNGLIFSPTGDFQCKVGNGYVLSQRSAHEVDIVREDVTGSGDAIIPSKVIALNVYHDWVFAKRQGLKPESNERSYQVPDENVFDYQVLNTRANHVYIFATEAQMRAYLAKQAVPNKPLLTVEEFKSKAWYQLWF